MDVSTKVDARIDIFTVALAPDSNALKTLPRCGSSSPSRVFLENELLVFVL